MQDKTNLNLSAVRDLVAQIQQAQVQQQTELRLSMTKAKAAYDCLTVLMTKLIEYQSEIIELQRRVIEAETVNIELKGDSF